MKRATEDGATEEQFRVPEGWGEDEVTHVLQMATRNSYYTVNRNRAAVKRFRTAARLFSSGAEQYSTVRGAHLITDARFFNFDYALPFLMSCRVSLLAAATLAFGHQLPDSAKPARGAIEAAFYGYHVFKDASAWDRWTDRPLVAALRRSEKEIARRQRSAVGREFSVTAIAKEFPQSAAKLVTEAVELYDELIDVGGHFNMPAFQGGTRVSADAEATTVHFTVIGADDRDIKDTLDRLNRTASVCLRIFDLVFRDLWRRSGLPVQIAAFTFRR
jgi:hypothetical protein